MLIRTDSVVAAAYVNREGGVRSSALYRAEVELWLWAHQNLLSWRALHIPSSRMLGWAWCPAKGPRQDEWHFTFQHCQTDLTEVQDGSSGPVCIQGECPLRDVVLSPPARLSPFGFDEACSMATGNFVCVPSTVADPPSTGEGPTEESVAHLGGIGVLVGSVTRRTVTGS